MSPLNEATFYEGEPTPDDIYWASEIPPDMPPGMARSMVDGVLLYANPSPPYGNLPVSDGHTLWGSRTVVRSVNPGSLTPYSPASENWTPEQEQFLLDRKSHGDTLSVIGSKIHQRFGVKRSNNVLSKKYNKMRGICKNRVQGKIIRDVSKRVIPQIIQVVGSELERSYYPGIAGELEDMVSQKLPLFLEGVVADLCMSLGLSGQSDE